MGQVQFLPDHHLTQAWASNSELKGRPYSIGFNSTGCKFWLSLVSQGVGDKLFSLPTCTHLHLNNGDNSSGFWESSRQWCDMLSAPPTHTHNFPLPLPLLEPKPQPARTVIKRSICASCQAFYMYHLVLLFAGLSPPRGCVFLEGRGSVFILMSPGT